MTFNTLYAGQVNSPNTTLSSGIDDSVTTIPVTELGVFPAGPNLAVIGTGSTAETILYTDKSAATGSGNLTGCTRAYDSDGTYGVAAAWLSGDVIARNFTEHDWATIKNNAEDLNTEKIGKSTVDAKGDLIVGTADNTVARHAVGTDLYPLVAKSGVTNGIAWEQLTEGGIVLADVTTLDASTTKHGLAPKATAPAAGIINLLGIANGETAYTCKALLDDTNPEALGTAGPGTATVAARRDHVHSLPKGGVLSWSEVTGTTQSCAVNTGYILNNAALVTATLPATASVGDVIRIVGKGAGMWKLEQNASQYIRFAGLTTTTGTGGYLQAENDDDCIEIMCTTANNGWTVISSIGNIEVV